MNEQSVISMFSGMKISKLLLKF